MVKLVKISAVILATCLASSSFAELSITSIAIANSAGSKKTLEIGKTEKGQAEFRITSMSENASDPGSISGVLSYAKENFGSYKSDDCKLEISTQNDQYGSVSSYTVEQTGFCSMPQGVNLTGKYELQKDITW